MSAVAYKDIAERGEEVRRIEAAAASHGAYGNVSVDKGDDDRRRFVFRHEARSEDTRNALIYPLVDDDAEFFSAALEALFRLDCRNARRISDKGFSLFVESDDLFGSFFTHVGVGRDEHFEGGIRLAHAACGVESGDDRPRQIGRAYLFSRDGKTRKQFGESRPHLPFVHRVQSRPHEDPVFVF